jgi:type III secretory pathway component EscT
VNELSLGLFGESLQRVGPVAGLLLARLLPLAWVAPWLGWGLRASLLRGLVVVVLAVGLLPVALAHTPQIALSVSVFGLAALRELVIGATFAVAVSVPLYALSWSGRLMDEWRGASFGGEAPRALGQLYLGAAVVVFWALGGHRLALTGFASTLSEVPLATVSTFSLDFLLGALRVVVAALELALAFAAPAALAMVFLELMVGVWARLSPSFGGWLEVLSVRSALLIAAAGLGLSALVPRLGPIYARSIELTRDVISTLAGS